MPQASSSSSTFLKRVIEVIEAHLEEEDFGVQKLAEEIGMSRSNLLRKVKQETGESISVLIRNVRLDRAKELLNAQEFTISEISYKVGFGSASYFTKCFRERFGHPPGEAISHESENEDEIHPTKASPELTVTTQKSKNRGRLVWIAMVLIVSLGIAALIIQQSQPAAKSGGSLEKSIAVLPFKNDSPDSTNIYFMNGLMEAILDNFQKVEELQITSRTTVEQFRQSSMTIPELSEKLQVNYFIEGSGQKVGDQILLTIQLIEGPTDRHLWSKRYLREIEDVFALQSEVAKNIAKEIDAIITPAENKRIEQVPTENLVAYDYYLRGLVLLRDQSGAGLKESIVQFKKAIKEDGSFAEAYAYVAIANYYLDMFQSEKLHIEGLKNYADKAMQLDSSVGVSQIARGMYYIQIEDYPNAISALENVLEYYPNLAWIHNLLSNIYAFMMPDTEKYLEHALQGLASGNLSTDSSEASYSYLHLSNALTQGGFINEAEEYVQKSLAYNPNNHFSKYLYVYIKLAQDLNMIAARDQLLEIYQEDTSRIDVIQEVAKVYYNLQDYGSAWIYYERMLRLKDLYNLDLYESEGVKIAFVLEKLGRAKEAKRYYDAFLQYAESDQSIYRDLNLCSYYAAIGELDKAMDYFKSYAKAETFQLWFILFLEQDPIFLEMQSMPDFKPTMLGIREVFWQKNEDLRSRFKEDGIL